MGRAAKETSFKTPQWFDLYETFSKGDDIYIRTVNQERIVIYENPALRKKFGNGLGNFCYQLWQRQSPCKDCVSERALLTKTPQTMEETTPEGRVYLMVSIPINTQKRWSTVEIIQDITERKVIRNINNILVSSLDIKDVYSYISEELNKVMDFDRMSITLLDETEEGTFETFVLTKGYEHTDFKEGTHYPLKGSIMERILSTKEPINVEDTRKGVVQTDSILLREGIRSRLAFPLEYKRKVIGSLNFGSKKPNSFTRECYGLLAQIGPNLAISAENTRLFREIKHSEEKYRGLIEDSPHVTFACSLEGIINLVSPSVKNLTGYSPEEFYTRGDLILSLLHPEDKDKVKREMEMVIRGEKVVSKDLEFRILHKDGMVVWLSQDSYPMRDPGGNTIGLEGLCRDITETKKLEELKDNLMRDITHELKTPLAKMEMGLHLYEQALKAGEGKEAEKRRAAFDLLLSNIHRLKHTVQNIIDLSRLESGQIPLKKEEVDLDILVSKALKEIEKEASKKGLQLINSFPKDIYRVHGDSEKLQHVLLNLLDNSVKYTNQGSVTVSGRKLPGEVEVSVTDTGRGLEKDLLGKVFERFVQESPSFVGLGIGLTICREIVQRHGGKIWAESGGRDKGTTFRFTLPLNTP